MNHRETSLAPLGLANTTRQTGFSFAAAGFAGAGLDRSLLSSLGRHGTRGCVGASPGRPRSGSQTGSAARCYSNCPHGSRGSSPIGHDPNPFNAPSRRLKYIEPHSI